MTNERRQAPVSRLLRVLKSTILGISISGGLGLMFFVVVHGDHGYLALQRSLSEEKRLAESVRSGQERNEALQREIKRLKGDPQWIEKIAREELGLTRPKDVILKLNSPPDSNQK